MQKHPKSFSAYPRFPNVRLRIVSTSCRQYFLAFANHQHQQTCRELLAVQMASCLTDSNALVHYLSGLEGHQLQSPSWLAPILHGVSTGAVYFHMVDPHTDGCGWHIFAMPLLRTDFCTLHCVIALKSHDTQELRTPWLLAMSPARKQHLYIFRNVTAYFVEYGIGQE